MKKLTELSPHVLLAAVFILSLMSFALVELYPSWFYRILDSDSFLVFHNIAEFFSIMVALSIFGIGWFTFDQSKNRHALFLGCAFLAIALMDFMHTFSYTGMPAFITPNPPVKSNHFWIGARMFSALAFLVSGYVQPGSSPRFLSKGFLLASAVAVPGVVFAGVIFFPSYLPATIIEGKGLTPFNVYSEYLIALLFAFSIPAYWRRYADTGKGQLIYFMAALIISIFSELAFSGYTSVFDTNNVLGHIYKIIAFCLIYQGIFIAAIKSPYLELAAKTEELRIEAEENKKAADLHKKGEERFQMLAENSRDMIYRMSLPDWKYEYVSPASVDVFGYSPEEFYSSPMLRDKVIHPAWHGYFEERWGKILTGDLSPFYEYQIIDRAGETKWLYQRNILIKDDGGKPIAIQGTIIDITERKQSEERIVRLSRLNSVLSKTNEAIARTYEPEELYRQTCRIVVEDGLFRMAWIGMIDPDTSLVNPVASYGHEDGYLEQMKISADEHVPEGRGPAGIAMRTGGHYICNDIEHDPVMTPWRDEALRRGYRSSAAFALKSGANTIGILNVYSDVADFFHEDEIQLKISLAEDISHAIESMESEKQRITAVEELRELSIALENRVKERTDALQESNLAMMNIVDDLSQKALELEQVNEKLKEIDRLKAMFIASMSHELRTPLNSIIGFSSIIRDEWIGPVNPEQKENLDTIKRSGKHLLSLINDVIDVTKIEAGRIEASLEEFDLYDLLTEAVQYVEADLRGKGLELHLDIHHHPLCSDRRRLLQCVINLLSNTVKFTEHGKVTVSSAVADIGQDTGEKLPFGTVSPLIDISVADSGIGIAEEDIPRLFQPFVRLESSLKTTAPGTGLGLYLTRKLVVEVLGGDILCKSTIGVGSTFTLRIPERMYEKSTGSRG